MFTVSNKYILKIYTHDKFNNIYLISQIF